MRRLARLLGTLLLVAGVLTLAWVVTVWRWEDPFTAAYTYFEQSHLSHEYNQRAAAFHPKAFKRRDLASELASMAADAHAYAQTLHTGDPLGRITIGRIGVKMVVVQGTDHETLKKGPGHYIDSGLPGEGRLIYVAGHRTTYLAPFSHIDDIRAGDYIKLQVPYGTFTYRVTRHYVVADNDLAVLQNHGKEILRLQACHPRFFATNRYIVDAKLVNLAPAAVTPSAS